MALATAIQGKTEKSNDPSLKVLAIFPISSVRLTVPPPVTAPLTASISPKHRKVKRRFIGRLRAALQLDLNLSRL
jgi:hypothetical protein